LATLCAATQRGAYTFLEQPTRHFAFFQRIQREQIAKYPELSNEVSALDDGPKAERRNARRARELQLADCIVCNSQFTKRTLIDGGVASEKIEVIPLAFPPAVEHVARARHPVIFLAAGTQSLTKGSHLLYKAWRELAFRPEEAELWLVGKMLLPEALRRDLPGRVHIHGSVSRRELMELYHEASVLVLPSLGDGFGQVVTEAMCCGVPVITTTNTGAGDVIAHGRNGWIIEAGREEALQAQMK